MTSFILQCIFYIAYLESNKFRQPLRTTVKKLLYRLTLSFFDIIYTYFASNRFGTWIFEQQQISNKFLYLLLNTISFYCIYRSSNLIFLQLNIIF